ncbi:hypothetical protein MKK75_12265 [Methylobacterium sp. J-030]|uniref:hypothetical protein n=1 Tax=Methylobacterium sp. J-030 TaxID=2836627 RepID=UPI001FB862ED|nr:hypothetical protein [Methylobacterium sp. J-030]MCJ2069554.1 hypothetical protein [Methylobacterium sp. J-030]
MSDEADSILAAVAALLAPGIVVAPIGEEPDHWQIGCFTFTDAELLRRAEIRGLREAS